jgi:predicted nucleic acid-binding protein
MQKIFLDTNVLLDLLLERWIDSLYAKSLFSASLQKKIIGVFSVISVATLLYMLQKNKILQINEKITLLLDVFDVFAIDESMIRLSFETWFSDGEDALQHVSAKKSWCYCIITNDKKWFINASIPVYTPKHYLDAYL